MFGSEKEISGAFELALKLESEGYEFYTGCEKSASDETVKELFNFLASEEKHHYEVVEEVYERQLPGEYQDFAKDHKVDMLSTGVFDEMSGNPLSETAGIIAALKYAQNAEHKSIDLYRKLSDESVDWVAKKIFEDLAFEEEKHLQILEEEEERLNQK